MYSISATVFQSTRPKFIVLAPICVLLGVSGAFYQYGEIDVVLTIYCLLIGIFAHTSVNLLNEYQDAKSGLDKYTEKTPFSGGSGALQKHPAACKAVGIVGYLSLAVFCMLGLYVVLQINALFSIIGLVGIAVVLTYTPWLNQQAWLCLVAPGLGFGLLMVNGTYAVLTGGVDSISVWLSISVFCLTNNLLLLNQYPDAIADKTVGRKHFVIRYGYKKSSLVYLIFAVGAYLSIIILVLNNTLPNVSLLALIGLPFNMMVAAKAKNYQTNNIGRLLPYMALNVTVTLAVPLIVAITLFFA